MDEKIINMIIQYAQESGRLKGTFEILRLYMKLDLGTEFYKIDRKLFDRIIKNVDEISGKDQDD
jgi:hypothetical protein